MKKQDCFLIEGETTRECVRVHFRSRDKDGVYTIQSAVPKNPVLHANITAIELELLSWKFYIVGIGIFDLFGYCDLDLDPMSFIYELDP